LLTNTVNYPADRRVLDARLADGDCRLPGVVGCLDQLLGGLVHLAHDLPQVARQEGTHSIHRTHSTHTDRHLAAVTVVAVEVHRDIYVEHIAVLPEKKNCDKVN